MTKLNVVYTHGTGGHWLGHLLWLAQYRKVPVDPAAPNFHNHKQTDLVKLSHTPVADDCWYFTGRSGFNFYLNFWRKHRKLYQKPLSFVEDVYTLSDEATWRQSADYHKNFVLQIDIDYTNIFLDPVKFRSQFNWLCEHVKLAPVSQSFVDAAIMLFQNSCEPPTDHISNYDSRPWLAWCHSVCLLNQIDCPVLVDNWQIRNFFQARDRYFVDALQPFVLNH
jgi:hypothetical protein